MSSSISTKISGSSDAANNQIFIPKQQADELHPTDLTAQHAAKPIFTKKSSDSPIAEMPNEVKYHVLFSLAQKLPPKEAIKEILKMSLMSKNWRNVSRVVLTDLINKRKLSLSEIGIDTAEKALCFLKTHGKNLKHLDLNGLEMCDRYILEIIKCYPKLESLSINSDTTNNVAIATAIVKGCKKLTSAAIIAVAENCKNLKKLDISYNQHITEEVAAAIGGGLTNLIDLDLQLCWNLSDTALISILEGCENLENLNLGYCQMITDRAVIVIAERCKKLKTLNLRYCCNLTNTSSRAIARGLKNLTSLNLEGCERIIDNTERIIAIALPAIPFMVYGMCYSDTTMPRIFAAVADSLGISESTVHVAATIGIGVVAGIVIEKYDLSFGWTRYLAKGIKKFASVDYSLFWRLIRGELGNDSDRFDYLPDFCRPPAFRWIR